MDVLKLLDIVREAGSRMLASYCSGRVTTRVKDDLSPVTDADMASHHFLCEALGAAYDFPIVSEEGSTPYEERRKWDAFWLIDPLDGTKEFLARTDEFTINVALIVGTAPKVGVVYAPALDEMYYACQGQGAYLVGCEQRLPRQLHRPRVALASRFHQSAEADRFAINNGVSSVQAVGAALKFCRLARGDALLYPRFSGSMEWDTAAGQLLVTEAGGAVLDLETMAAIVYNKPSIKNGPFLAVGDVSIMSELNMSTGATI